MTGDYLSDDGEIVRRWALAGHGIAYKANLDIASDIQAGRLVPLLTDWQGEPTPFNLMCPQSPASVGTGESAASLPSRLVARGC